MIQAFHKRACWHAVCSCMMVPITLKWVKSLNWGWNVNYAEKNAWLTFTILLQFLSLQVHSLELTILHRTTFRCRGRINDNYEIWLSKFTYGNHDMVRPSSTSLASNHDFQRGKSLVHCTWKWLAVSLPPLKIKNVNYKEVHMTTFSSLFSNFDR